MIKINSALFSVCLFLSLNFLILTEVKAAKKQEDIVGKPQYKIINIGDKKVEFKIKQQNPSFLFINAVIPLANTTMSVLVDNNIILTKIEPVSHFYSENAEKLSGGHFILPLKHQLKGKGEYKIRFSFPKAKIKAKARLSVLDHLDANTSLALSSTKTYQGNPISIAMIANLSGDQTSENHSISAYIFDDSLNQIELIELEDNGQGADNIQNDGIFTGNFIPNSTGDFIIQTLVDNAQNPDKEKSIFEQELRVLTSPATIKSLDYQFEKAKRNGEHCITQITQETNVNINNKGRYLFSAILENAQGDKLTKQKTVNYAKSGLIFGSNVSWSSDEIVANLSNNPPYSITYSQLTYLDGISALPIETYNLNEKITLKNVDQICLPKIYIHDGIEVIEHLKQDFIGKLEVLVTVSLQQPGVYQLSVNAKSQDNKIIKKHRFKKPLHRGENKISLMLDSSKLQAIDGAIKITNMSISSSTNSITKNIVGESKRYSKYQMFPLIEGDLNNDGIISVADSKIINQYRSFEVYIPGDRRDIDRNGRIDIRDVELISRHKSRKNNKKKVDNYPPK